MVEDEDSENHLEEVEVDKSILQTSSSQLLYKICENGSCKLDDESIVCVISEIIKYLLSKMETFESLEFASPSQRKMCCGNLCMSFSSYQQKYEF